MLNCIEIIFLSKRRQSPSLSQSPTSVKLLVPCLLIFSFRNQQEDKAETIPAETRAQPGAGSTVGPQPHPENAKCINTEHHFPILRSKIAVVAKERCEHFPAENKRQERSRGR